jgi:hypothetical protein
MVIPFGGRRMDFVVIGVLSVALIFSIYLNVMGNPEAVVEELQPLSVLIADFENRTGDEVFDDTLESALQIARVQKNPEPRINVTGFGDSSVNLELRVWINDPQQGRGTVISDVLLVIWDLFHEHGIEIPFPQRDLHLKSVLGEQEVSALREVLKNNEAA